MSNKRFLYAGGAIAVAVLLALAAWFIWGNRGPASGVTEALVESRREENMAFYARYPRLLNGKRHGEWNRRFVAMKEDLLSQARERAANDETLGGEQETAAIQATLNYQVAMNNRGYMSVLLDRYLAGGGSPDHRVIPLTIDLKSGKNVKLFDLFRNRQAAVSRLNEAVEAGIAQRGLEPALINPFTSVKEDTRFYLLEGYLVVQFDRAELTPYYMGELTFPIALEELSDILISRLR